MTFYKQLITLKASNMWKISLKQLILSWTLSSVGLDASICGLKWLIELITKGPSGSDTTPTFLLFLVLNCYFQRSKT